jgi:hypothetical protein
MSTKEKQSIVTLISTVLILGFYALYVYQNYLKTDWALINDFKFWGTTFLIMIPVMIVAQIIIHIIFAIVNKIVTNEDMDDLSDERDKLIDLKAIRISHWIFSAGFLSAMSTQAMGMEPWVMFVTLITSGFLSGIVSESAKIYFYRRGF